MESTVTPAAAWIDPWEREMAMPALCGWPFPQVFACSLEACRADILEEVRRGPMEDMESKGKCER